jgi:Crp-like helix-turn-helix protein
MHPVQVIADEIRISQVLRNLLSNAAKYTDALLLSLDRLSSNQLTMTQELIANILGVRREGVTEAAGKLHKLGVIRHARGRITVTDRPMLEKLCCECYAVVKKESDRLLAPHPGSKMAAERGGDSSESENYAQIKASHPRFSTTLRDYRR